MAKFLGWYRPEILVLKINLAGSDTQIWRRVELHSGLTLHDLHYVIQKVFEWEQAHLYQFIVPPGGKFTPEALRDAKRYHMMEAHLDSGPGQEGPADEAMLGRIFTPECKQIVYVYDFGDSWEHIVELENRAPTDDMDHMPVCLAGENAAPRDDIGGMPGYYDLLDALKDTRHEMHGEAIELFGKDFDPSRFDLAKVNKRLAATFKPVPKKPKKPRKKK